MLECRKIWKSFNNKDIIKEYSYTFEDNKIYAITGASGKGKTTLLRMLCGLLSPDNGEILLNGKKVNKAKGDIYMVHQHYSNFPFKTCIDNVLFPISFKRKVTENDMKEAEYLLKRVGLYHCKDRYPSELSGGMNQRLALARTLISKPKVVLMDEPMSALDKTTRAAMQDLVLEMQKELKNTIIMVTHDDNEANKMADYIIKL